MVVTLRCRIVRKSVWKPATNLVSCPGFVLVRILRFAWVSINVTSISAIAALVLDVYLLGVWDHVYWGYTKNCAKGGFDIAMSSLFCTTSCCKSCNFLASSDCKRCSSSFTNSMAPPTIEAWSPYNKTKNCILINWTNSSI